MENFFVDFAISTLITLLRRMGADRSLKGPYRAVFLKVFMLIWGVFQNDPNFRSVVGAPVEHDPELIAEAGPIVYPGGRS